ncbi:diaminopimelate epimerase [Novilysobacter spongiicola]|uniref:Diaminopimelate epimerase n=1 Tax=Lysobacter spongiicola DSM 21749 TaxID=1122188 RepID=A0A1T4PMS6_9GAMM|nr:diaminopimelate epimerase [Lysobacter spongiicola]SJZ92894.1 diaminopimelate epimerase [Lysobacter spongiicola DSM 21749]
MVEGSRLLRFTKMHGAGNDFIVLDLRHGAAPPSPDLCRAMADRHRGVGCDQILTVEAPRETGSVAAYRIWNSDGSPSGQCGNGARCVAAWLWREGAVKGKSFQLDSPGRSHHVERLDGGNWRISMGVPEFDPARIPLLGFDGPRDPYVIATGGSILGFGAVSMGNPHAVLEVQDLDAADVAGTGAQLQALDAFPESANIGFAQVQARDSIRLRVFERGVGETLACGSGACAAVAVLVRRGLVDRAVTVHLPGGDLHIDWPADDAPVAMAGPAAFVFEGEWLHD